MSRALWVIVFGLPAAAAVGAEKQYAVEVGLGTSSNIERTVDAGRSETIASLGTQFTLQQDTRKLYANLDGDLTWLEYLDNTYDSELIGNAGATLRASLVEDVLAWSFVDRFGQTRTDLLAPPTPSNREYVNQFSTGPDVAIRLGGNLHLQASGRYMRVDYEDSPFNSQRFAQSLGLRREMSSGTNLTLRATAQQIDPDDAPIYDLSEAVLAYESLGARTDISVEAGVSRIHERGGDSDPNEVLRLEISRRLGGGSTLTLSGGREYADPGGSMGGWQGEGLPQEVSDTLDLTQTSDPYVADTARISWRIQGRVTTLEFAGTWQMQDFTSVGAVDRRQRGLMVRGARRMGPRLDVGAELRHVDNDLRGRGQSKENAAAVNLGWRLGRRLSIQATGEFLRFQGELESGTARDNRFWLRLRYGTEEI